MKPCFCPIFSMPVSFLSPYTAHPVYRAPFCMVPVSRRSLASAGCVSYGSRTIYVYIYTHHACICTSQSRQFCSARIHLRALSSFVRTMFANYAHAHGGLTISFTCIVCVWLLQTYFYSFLQGWYYNDKIRVHVKIKKNYDKDKAIE